MCKAHEVSLERLGITLNLRSSPNTSAGSGRANIMFSLFANIARFFRTAADETPASPASLLMESADLRAGHDAHDAQDLRVAASAWLRVVR